ncbi:hypothetical protein GTP46_10590 [Duganella sp. FT135W]|uniref:Transporter substrate-binding domain-containing protein n=1 Tax=Duganella flavida TaxID=2692175 RepID=A0A6L8K6H9_9BURK|nr:hypothetical protein [Duganella flavida]MYM23093.1 hypothetical protein [Duganella flavida]
MKHWFSLSLLLLVGANAHAAEPCKPVRFGYSDRERVPYYMGNGNEIPEKPGVLVDLFRNAFRSVDCPLILVRLPVARVRIALMNGAIDVAPADPPDASHAGYVVATTANGDADHKRALRTNSYVFVRMADKLAPDTDPMAYFKTRSLAANQGTSLAAQLKAAGLQVDDGSFSSWNNFDKLRLKRVDGFTLALLTPTALDAYLNARYGQQLMRLDKPVRTSYMWLGANRTYYDQHRAQVEAVWNWLGAHGARDIEALSRNYALTP